jgi:hypothetical protein
LKLAWAGDAGRDDLAAWANAWGSLRH